MKLGIFGSEHDAQCQAVRAIAQRKGCEVVIVESQGLNLGQEAAFDGEDFSYGDIKLSDVGCWYLRYIMSCLPPAFEASGEYFLFSDWFTEYMQRRERQGFQLSALLALSLRGRPLVNSPEHGSVIQLKPFQLQAARAAGLECPKTLITNSPKRANAFIQEVEQAVYKPTMGGGLCQKVDDEAMSRLDQIVKSPVIFQSQVLGTSVRLTLIGEELVSAVSIPTSHMDYRQDPVYASGQQLYEKVMVPDELVQKCVTLMRACGLVFSGLDFIKRPDGSYVFLEANSSPIYLDIEQKTKTPITEKLVEYMLFLANEPSWYKERMNQAERPKSFLKYANPFSAS